ncbi:MAG: pyridoxal phosphate-dependent aminotransferase [Clostridia bacterium]|nr:pyridoxal phosphate-dependent aminotransferase [Clostridia bacterium]
MVSKEMLALGKKSSVIREIFEYAKQRKAEIGAENVFDFSLGNPSIPAPAVVGETMQRLLTETDPVALHGYTSAPGDLGVRRIIAQHVKERFDFDADAALIYMTCGAAASLTISLRALCSDGDEVLLLAPFFPEYQVFVRNAGAVPVVVPAQAGTLTVDFEALSAAINAKTRAIIVNSPNNPSGVVLDDDCISRLAALLTEKSEQFGRPIAIIADEPYRELVYDGTEVPYIPGYYDHTLVCYSYSKSLSLPGERIGYILVSPHMQGAGDVFAAICGAGRSLGFVCAPSLLQLTVGACDGTPPDLTAYDANRTLLYSSLTEIGYEAVRPDGAFYLFVKSLEPDAYAFCERAKKFELLLVPSDDFGVSGYVRIAYCVSYEQIRRSLPAFRALYEDYNKE